MAAAYRDRTKFDRLTKEYELTCLGIAPPVHKPKKRPKVDPEVASFRCPDGTYVGGEDGCRRDPTGRPVQDGPNPIIQCSDGTYTGAKECVRGPNGKYVR